METLNEKAAALLQKCEVVALTSVNKEGYPRPVPVTKVKADGYATVWMATGYDSWKTNDFRRNPKAGLCYYEAADSVCLTGRVEVITDPAVKQELWQDWFIAHFPQGPSDPTYVLLKFTGVEATFWIGGAFIHRKVK